MICLYRNGKVRKLPLSKILINRNTPVGEPPVYYEIKPYHGRRFIGEEEILGFIKNGELEIYSCNMTEERLEVIKSLNIPLSNKLFHNGRVYTTIKKPFKTLEESLKENYERKT